MNHAVTRRVATVALGLAVSVAVSCRGAAGGADVTSPADVGASGDGLAALDGAGLAGDATAPARQDAVAVKDTVPVGTDTAAASEVTPASAGDASDATSAKAGSPLIATGAFVDRWGQLGLTLATSPSNKGKMIEASSSAALLIDLDQDDLVDFVAVDGIDTAWWGQNFKPWKWFSVPLFKAKEPGLKAIAATDVDGDGWPEIALGGGQLYFLVRTKNETYENQAAERGLQASKQAHTQHIATADLDSDGLLDLVTTEYSCSGQNTVRGFINLGNGTYADATYALGIGHKSTGWFTLPFDADGDGQIDLLVGHENCAPSYGNAWLRNKGHVAAPPRFENVVVPPVFEAPKSGGLTPMGAAAGDPDGDGDLDVVVTATGLRGMVASGISIAQAKVNPSLGQAFAHEANLLLLRSADGAFSPSGLGWGLGFATSETGKPMVSWSAPWLDFDADGWPDLLMTHGDNVETMLLGDEGGARPVLFRHDGIAAFTDVSAQFGLPAKHMGRALSLADVDGDGDLDALSGAMDGQPLLLDNQVAAPKHWLSLRLRGKTSNVWGIGARVALKTTGRTLVAAMGASAPTQTADPPVLHFVWPPAWSAIAVEIQWPSGYLQVVPVAKVDAPLTVVEPLLAAVSARLVASGQPGAKVVATAQAHGPDGKPLAGVATAIELAPGAKGSWQGPTTCTALGACTRVWLPKPNGWGADAIAISFGGQPLGVMPIVRFDVAP